MSPSTWIKRTFFMLTIIALTSIALTISPTAGQDNTDDACSTMISDALQIVGSACAEMGRNEACYGHIELEATFQTDSAPPFADSGDLIEISHLQSLTTQPINPDTGAWGIGLMLVQADLPDVSGAAMTFVLMGDTQVNAATASAEDLAMCSATNDTSNNLNIRSEPDTNAPIVGTISPNSSVMADGRNAASNWLHVETDEATGWVFASLLTLDCDSDSDTLALRNTSDEPLAPLQAFTLQTTADGTCDTVPDGLLIRSPEGQRARVIVNGVELVFSSTGYLSTPSDQTLSIQGVSGQIEVTADGQTETITPDFFTTVPLANLEPDGPPAPPEPVSDAQTILLPTFSSVSDTLNDNGIGVQACTISASGTVNQRSGPSTTYELAGQLSEGDSAAVIGQATGSDGAVWWQLADGTWVRSDLVDTFGQCSDVPSVTPPPTPTPDPNASGLPQDGLWRWYEVIVESDCPESVGFEYSHDVIFEFSPDRSTLTLTRTTGTYAYFDSDSFSMTLTTGTTYIVDVPTYPPRTRTISFTSATTGVGESYIPPAPGYCETRWRYVLTKY